MRETLLAVCTVALLGLGSSAQVAGAQDGEPPVERAPEQPRFRTVDVIVDSAKKKLAAYQVEITFDSERVKIVSLEGGSGEEGGEGGAGFAEPPFYDAAGKTAGRIVIAGFVADDAQAKAGRTRVARLHIMVEGDATIEEDDARPEMTIEPVTAARPGGEKIQTWPEIVHPRDEARESESAVRNGEPDGAGEGDEGDKEGLRDDGHAQEEADANGGEAGDAAGDADGGPGEDEE